MMSGNRNAWLADEVGDYLASGLGLVAGSSLYVGELPEANISGEPLKDSIFIIELPMPLSKAENMYIDTETHMLQIWSTSSSADTAYELIHRVYDMLHRRANYSFNNWYIYFSQADSTIKDEGRGRENNKLFSLSVTLICRNVNNLS